MDPTAFVIPCLLAGVALYALTRRVDVYAALTQGAGEGLTVVAKILPALVGLLTAVYMLRASGAMDALAAALAPVLGLLGIPPETAALLLVRPVSGSGALAVGSQIMEQYGPDSAVGRTAHPVHHSCRPDGGPGRFRGRRLGGAPVLRVKTAFYTIYWGLYGHDHCKETRKPPLCQVTVF